MLIVKGVNIFPSQVEEGTTAFLGLGVTGAVMVLVSIRLLRRA